MSKKFQETFLIVISSRALFELDDSHRVRHGLENGSRTHVEIDPVFDEIVFVDGTKENVSTNRTCAAANIYLTDREIDEHFALIEKQIQNVQTIN